MANREAEELEASVPKRFSSFIVDVPVQQDGEGDPSPDNVRYITQWSKVDAFVADSISEDTPVATVELPSPIYGGRIDVVRGEVASTYNVKMNATGWEMVEEGQFRCSVSAYNNGDETSTNVADLYSSHYKTVSNKDAYDGTDDLTCGLATIDGITYLYVNDAGYTTLEAFTAYVGAVMFVYKAHIPMSDAVDPQIIFLPEGTSYVWATGVEVVADVVIELVGNAAPIVRYFPHNSVATECDVSFTPVQDLHGYDSPWPAGGGVNKFDKDTLHVDGYLDVDGNVQQSSVWGYSDYIPVSASTAYTASGYTAGGNAPRTCWYDSNKEFISSYQLITPSTTATSPSNAAYVRCSIHMGGFDTFQYEQGSIATAYSPYSNTCPISGWNTITAWDDAKYGGNIEWNQLWKNSVIPTDSALYSVSTYTSNGVTFTKNSDNSITFQTDESGATADVSVKIAASLSGSIGSLNYVHYIGTGCEGSASTYYIVYGGSRYSYDGAVFQAYNSGYNMWLEVKSGFISTEPITVHPQICNLTQMFGAGNEPTTIEEFRALFPNAYYTYNAGTVTNVSAVSNLPYSKASVTFPTQYGGTADIVGGTGSETLTKVRITSFTASWGATTNGFAVYASVPNTARDRTMVNLCDKFVHANSSYTYSPAYSYGCNNGANTTWSFILPPTVHNLSEANQWIIDNGGYIEFTAQLATPTSFTFTPASDELTIQKNKNYLWATMT